MTALALEVPLLVSPSEAPRDAIRVERMLVVLPRSMDAAAAAAGVTGGGDADDRDARLTDGVVAAGALGG